jgi:S-ribosylhomocysteine lyase LuxS involved in autoinducer biosynthesis
MLEIEEVLKIKKEFLGYLLKDKMKDEIVVELISPMGCSTGYFLTTKTMKPMLAEMNKRPEGFYFCEVLSKKSSRIIN